jgi:hypothetical protein
MAKAERAWCVKSSSRTVRCVILEEAGLPHTIPNLTEFKVLVMRPEDRGGENDPSREFPEESPEGEPQWSVQREFDLEIEEGNPLTMAPVAEALGFHGYYREVERIWIGYIYLHLRMYAKLREALGIEPSQDGYRWQPFGRKELSWGGPHAMDPSYDGFCKLVGKVFGPESEAAQREAFATPSGFN